MKKRALCPLSGVHLTIKPNFPSSLRTVRRVAADAQEREQGKQKRQRLPVSSQRTKKTMLPKRETSSFVVVFLTRGKVGEAYQGERMSPSSAAASSPQMGLTNFSDIPPPEKPGTAGSPLPGNSSSKLSLSRHSCISSLTVVRLGLIYCNFIMCSVYLAMNFFPLVTYTPPLVVCCTRRPLKS